MSLANNIKTHLKNQGADFIHFVDISGLPKEQNKGFSNAILFGIVLSPKYLNRVSNSTGYVEKMKQSGQIENDEFHLTELKTDRIADDLEKYLQKNGFPAYSQSEANIEATGFYDKQNQTTPLPHKTIALMAGLGWIGKHNLLVTKEFGSAISMCTVLTDAPLKTFLKTPINSLCGDCNICVETCLPKALKGNSWEKEKSRDNLLIIKCCCTCFECLVHCPWTLNYTKRNSLGYRLHSNFIKDAAELIFFNHI